MATFHVDTSGDKASSEGREAYPRRAMAANLVAVFMAAASGVALLAAAAPASRRTAIALLGPLVPATACLWIRYNCSIGMALAGSLGPGCFLASLAAFADSDARGVALTGLLAAALAFLALECGAIFQSSRYAGTAVVFIATIPVLLSIAPFFAMREGAAPVDPAWVAVLFTSSPIAAASDALRVDLLRNDWLYSISTLGSSFPLGYPSACTYVAVIAIAGTLLHAMRLVVLRAGHGPAPRIPRGPSLSQQ